MRISTAKDIILTFLAETGFHKNATEISDRTKIDIYTVMTALNE